ncbi:MAG: gliding motility-associated ABC transporter substrate-binding protein GldG [Dokdonia sp.]|nr:gliding motility-associated ABC transporter substrate-binding protein GldG [Cytophagaceae bacterium]
MNTLQKIPALLLALMAFVLINGLATSLHKRLDLTQDQRYTLSDAAKEIIDQVESPLVIDVFLEGEFPAEFKRLQNETRYLLEEISSYNPNISFYFSNPVAEDSNADAVAQQFASFGMQPVNLTVKSNGKETQERIFPYATANHRGKAVPVSLFKNIVGASREQVVYASIQNLEYVFADAFNKLVNAKTKKIAVLKDNGELPDGKIADIFKKLGETYSIAPFPMEVANTDPEKALKALQNTFDLVVVAKPTKAFSDAQKFVLDQYTMQGGHSLWLLDAVAMETDSLRNEARQALAFPRALNLNDLFFKYGVRINPNLIKDLYAAPLSVAAGDGTQSQYIELPWFYNPLVVAPNTHPINTNIEKPIRFEYASELEILQTAKSIRKTVLLSSSVLTKIEGTPQLISLDDVNKEPDPKAFSNGAQPLAVLLEGSFESAFKNRVLPDELSDLSFRESATTAAKMVVIADGDLIANALDPKGRPLELGFDYLTRASYGNKEFLLNTVNYLLDDKGLINIRSKEIALPFLDTQKTAVQLPKWQALTLGLPLVILLVFGVIFYRIRRQKYAK